MKTYMLIIHALINKFHKDTSDIENIGHLFVPGTCFLQYNYEYV